MNKDLFPYEYCAEVMDIANANDKSWDIGLNMFLNNVQDAYQKETDPYWYSGADQLDYKALNDLAKKIGKTEVWVRQSVYYSVYRKRAIGVYARLRRAGENEALRALFLEDLTKCDELDEDTRNAIAAAAEAEGFVTSKYADAIELAVNPPED